MCAVTGPGHARSYGIPNGGVAIPGPQHRLVCVLEKMCGLHIHSRVSTATAHAPHEMRPRIQLTAVALVACAYCLFYPAFGAPVAEAAPVPTTQQWQRPTAVETTNIPASTAVAASTPARAPLEPLRSHGYFCQKGSCNLCHFRPKEIHPQDPTPKPGGDSPQGRVEGSNVTAAELADYGIRYLQVGGDWWNKCGDGWLNADFIYMRLPVGFVCEDWRTGRYILRQDAGHRWPFEDESFEMIYSEHMFEHILPMDGSSFLREMYRILKPGGVLRVTTPDLEKYLEGYVNRKTNTFLQDHAARFPPMGKLGPPYTAASVVNNIFRNYEHRWVCNRRNGVQPVSSSSLSLKGSQSVPTLTRLTPRSTRCRRLRGVCCSRCEGRHPGLGSEAFNKDGSGPAEAFPRRGPRSRGGGHRETATRDAREPDSLLAGAGGARAGEPLRHDHQAALELCAFG